MTLPSTSDRPVSAAGKPISVAYSYYALAILSLLNLLNYVDRFIFASLVPYIKDDLHFNDAQIGLFATAFTVVYTVLSPIYGYLADRRARAALISSGIAIWSIATALGGVAQNFWQMLIARAAVGIGEASYATISPGFLSDYFDRRRRGIAFGIFFTAVPIGQALGFFLGGKLGSPGLLGWRKTFFVVGIPGLIMALAAHFLHEPERGSLDEADDKSAAHAHGSFGKAEGSISEGYKSLLKNHPYRVATLGYAAMTFALGALSFWAVEMLVSDKGMDKSAANINLGIYVTLGGLLGTLIGGWIGDQLARWLKGGYFLLCGISALLGVVPLTIALASPTPKVIFPAVFATVFLLFLGNGPVNAIIVNVVPPGLRATAVATTILAIHFLGDALSTQMVGLFSTGIERYGLPTLIAPVISALGLSAKQHLSIALLITPLALIVACALFLLGLFGNEEKNVEGRQAEDGGKN
jgi:predicted MFS family arabinose efflux permease